MTSPNIDADSVSVGSLALRLIKGGLPAIAASAFVAFVPILGSIYLSVDEYAAWALAATLSTIFIVFDFGMPPLATRLAGTGELDFRTLGKLCGLSVLPPLLLGILAIFIWPLYSSAANLSADQSTMFVLIGLVAAGGSLRCVGLVYGAAALGRMHFYRRTAILFLGGSTQLVVTLVSLEAGLGIVSLGIGTVAAGFAQFAIGFLVEGRRRNNNEKLGPAATASIHQMIVLFAKTRMFVAMLGLSITQLDRWALGLLGDPELLSRYDIVTRFVMIPKILLIALSAGLIADASRLSTSSQGIALLARVQRLVFFVMLPTMALAAMAGYVVQIQALNLTPSVSIVVLIVAAHGANCTTIAPVTILTGFGRPDYELRYLIPLAGVAAIAYMIGIGTNNGVLLISVWAGAMVVFSLWFTTRSTRYIREGIK